MKILVVEDDQLIQSLVEDTVKDECVPQATFNENPLTFVMMRTMA